MGTIVITGASAGIGAAAAIELTRQGHEVLATGRSPSKLAAVHAKMVAAAPTGLAVPDAVVAELSSLAEVHRLSDLVLDRCPTLDVLANNAGMQTRRREVSADGFEMVLAVNHLAPFLMTNLLLERLRSSGGRVVTTSSSVHRVGKIDLDDLQLEKHWSGFRRSYGGSKLANVLFTRELMRRDTVPATCFHPGGVKTDLGRNSRLGSIALPFGRTPEEGAATLVWLATTDEGGKPSAIYYADGKPAKVSATGSDAELARRLWDASAQLVGLPASA
jgi:NAD(P)-dependent dehydrogenase (short-subunit alcohol dehydrogenase family)